MKIIDRIKSDPRTQNFWDEGDDGLWISLKDGYCWPGGDVHFIHERSIRDAWRALKTVRKCSCADCAGTTMKPDVRRYGPWQCKERPAGDWVVDQLDRETMRVRRYGPYPTEAEARTVYADLELEDATMKCWLRKRIKRLPLSPE